MLTGSWNALSHFGDGVYGVKSPIASAMVTNAVWLGRQEGGRRGSRVSSPKKNQFNYGKSGKNHAHQIVECSFVFWGWNVWGHVANSQRDGDQCSVVWEAEGWQKRVKGEYSQKFQFNYGKTEKLLLTVPWNALLR